MKASYLLSSIIFLAITGLGLSRIYESLPAQAIGITVASLTLLLLFAYLKIPSLNTEIESIASENLILLHAIRAPVGASFLIMWQEGLLAERFALVAGLGDIIVGALALLFAIFLNSKKLGNRRILVFGWNIVGFSDLLLAIGTGISIGIADQAAMIWISKLPLLIVPCFLVPVLMASHIILFVRFARNTA